MGNGDVVSEGDIPRTERGKVKRFPVVEVFGPTIQGEGIDQGVPCYFVRFGGCDYKCTWCDSPHAVLPQLVRHQPRLTTKEIVDHLASLTPGPRWVILSGGNPCLHNLGDLIAELHSTDLRVAVETQGTRCPNWLRLVDRICISPKPPSSSHSYTVSDFHKFIRELELAGVRPHRAFVKVVVLDFPDYEFARKMHRAAPTLPMFVSACNDAGATVGNPNREDKRDPERVARDLIVRGRWLANRVMVDPEMADVKVQMQQHVLYWGNERGR